jgi:hypothetical protein
VHSSLRVALVALVPTLVLAAGCKQRHDDSSQTLAAPEARPLPPPEFPCPPPPIPNEAPAQPDRTVQDENGYVSLGTLTAIFCRPNTAGTAPLVCMTPRDVPVPTPGAPNARARYYRITMSRTGGATPVSYDTQADAQGGDVYFWDGEIGSPLENGTFNLRVQREPVDVMRKGSWRFDQVYPADLAILKPLYYHPEYAPGRRPIPMTCSAW